MDSTQRRSSHNGSRNASPHAQQQNFMHQQGLDPSISPTTFTSNKFNTAAGWQNPWPGQHMSQNMPTLQTQDQLYSNNQFNQATFQNNHYDPTLNQADFYNAGNGIDTSDFNQNFYGNQGYPMNQHININPSDLNKIPSPDHTSPVGLLSPDNTNSPGAQNTSPTSTNGQYQTPHHSRHTSLDPSSAYELGNTWQGMNFQQHRRMPSDQHSDVSSVVQSPYLGNDDSDLNDLSKSPYLYPQNDSNTYGLESVNIGDQTSSQPGSAYVSPRLMPSQGLSLDPLAQKSDLGSDLFQSNNYQMNSMHNRNLSSVSDMGQADQFAVPNIMIDPAPVSRQASFGPQGEMDTNNALSPPASGGRGRNRSQSDTTGLIRPMNSRSVSPSVKRENSASLSVRSSSPGTRSRESSPGVQSGRITKDNRDRRASTSSIHSRDYILDLADPSRPSAATSSGGRNSTKHPASFSCNLCTKRFTRAYNLRSHLRTHTDERPFVCTVCGKAFARQHDRKRHEGLHSGEKKFTCKGDLKSRPGETWGCGRRFARADALGRHFRSEAGRVCIKPLLDEEAAERRNKQFIEHQQQQIQQQHAMNQQYMQGGLQPVPGAIIIPADPVSQSQQFTLPAVLMAQYPQLANLDWAALSSQNMADDGDLSDVGYDNSYDDQLDVSAGMGWQGQG